MLAERRFERFPSFVCYFPADVNAIHISQRCTAFTPYFAYPVRLSYNIYIACHDPVVLDENMKSRRYIASTYIPTLLTCRC